MEREASAGCEDTDESKVEQNAAHEPPPRAPIPDARALSDAEFAASTRFRRRSVSSSLGRRMEFVPLTTKAFRTASFKALGLSIPALILVAASVTHSFQFVKHAIVYWHWQLLAAFLWMSITIWISAPVVAAACSRHFLLMGCYFSVLFLSGIIAGGVATMLIYREFSLFDYIVKPLYWLSLYGVAPAFVVGTIGAAMLQRSLKKHATA